MLRYKHVLTAAHASLAARQVSLLSVVAVLPIGILVAVLLGFFWGRHYFHADVVGYAQASKQLAATTALLASEQQRLVNIEVVDEVNRLSLETLRRTVVGLQTEQAQLEAELYAYKHLVENDKASEGLHIEKVQVRATDDPRRFNYQIVVRRKAALGQVINASLSLIIEGERHNIGDKLALKQVDPKVRDDELAITLKYFKVLKGVFVLPPYFEPRRIVVTLKSDQQTDPMAIKEVSWRLPAI